MTQRYIAIVCMYANQLGTVKPFIILFMYIIICVVCVLYEGLLLPELSASESNAQM